MIEYSCWYGTDNFFLVSFLFLNILQYIATKIHLNFGTLRKLFLISFLLLFYTVLFSQKPKIDSLINVSSKNSISDSAKVRVFLKIGQAYQNINKNDSALIWFNKAEKTAKKISNSKNKYAEGSILSASCYYSKGFLQYQSLDFLSAEENYNKALRITNHLIKYSEHQNIITEAQKINKDIYSGIGNIYIDKGYYSVALKNFIKAQKLTDTLIKNGIIPENEAAAQYFHLGLIHYYLKNYKKSLKYYNKALKISEKYENIHGIAKINSNIGIVETAMNKTKKALKHFEKALKYAEDQNDEIFKAQIYDDMADCYIKQKDFHKAEIYLAKAMIIAEKLNNKQGKIYILLGLADVYDKTGRFEKALRYANRALVIAEKIQSISFIRDIYQKKSEIYENQHQFEKALTYYKKYKNLGDSIFNKEKNRQIQETESKYLASKKQEEINRQKLELAKRDSQIKIKRTQNYIFMITVFLLLLVIFFIFRNLKHKQKVNFLIKKQNKRITDSIEYAEKIQKAALPSEKVLNRLFKEHFILYKPLQIVSGDFYWAVKKDNHSIFAAADCTGHGIPGAFVSMLGISFLNELTLISDLRRPDLILEEMRSILKKSFRQTDKESEQTDGIDISLCSINNDTNELFFSGANNSAYLIRNKELIELEAVPNPVGVYYKELTFKIQKIKLQKNDIIYLFTDGYADQFGGNNLKKEKYTIKRFQNMLIEISTKSMSEQKNILEHEFELWKKDFKQIDDILIFGIKI